MTMSAAPSRANDDAARLARRGFECGLGHRFDLEPRADAQADRQSASECQYAGSRPAPRGVSKVRIHPSASPAGWTTDRERRRLAAARAPFPERARQLRHVHQAPDPTRRDRATSVAIGRAGEVRAESLQRSRRARPASAPTDPHRSPERAVFLSRCAYRPVPHPASRAVWPATRGSSDSIAACSTCISGCERSADKTAPSRDTGRFNTRGRAAAGPVASPRTPSSRDADSGTRAAAG